MIAIRSFVLAVAALILAAMPVRAQEFLPLTTLVELNAGDSSIEVGELIYRGGVEIAPDKANIGGISSLEWWDGKLYAVADDGRWVVLTPEDVAGRLVDVSAVELGPLRDAEGRKLSAKERSDAEAITRSVSGEWLVAFEREHRIARYRDIAGAAEGIEPGAAALVAAITDPNSGIETLAAYPGGLLACGEWVDPARPNCWRITSDGSQPFHLPAPAGIAEARGVPTDAACKADGTCYVLFRSYTGSAPAGQRNRAAIVELAPDAAPKTLAVLAPPMLLDNFEGLAVREGAGQTFLYLASDDNFTNCETQPPEKCQRTLLMKFEVKGPPAPLAAAAPILAPPPTPSTTRPGTRPHPAAATVTVVLTTSQGAITIALETERAPITAANFLRYVDEKRFDGTVFYRAMHLDREPRPNGLLQGGTQFDPKRILPGIRHEPTSQTGLTHTHGALSMAMGEPGSANGDFSIMIEDQTGLDADPTASEAVWRHGYAVFGYVTEGMDVVAAIHAAPRDPAKGEGFMKGELLANPVRILTARRADPAR